jgi:hypothetical protein
VVLEEWIKMQKANDRRMTDDGRPVVAIGHMTLWVRCAKNGIYVKLLL